MGSKLANYCVHHLKAFVYVLKATPQAVIKLNIEQLGPLLFKSLEEHNEAQSLCIALGICEKFVAQQDTYFKGIWPTSYPAVWSCRNTRLSIPW